jgi:hypothetical protein
MKSIRLSIIAILLLGAASCKKSNSGVSSNVSSTEALDIVSSSLSLNSNGVGTVASDAATVAGTQSVTLSGSSSAEQVGIARSLQRAVSAKGLECGDTKNDTVTRASVSGAAIGYSYTSMYSFTLHCNGIAPDSLTGSSAFSGTYSGPFISSTYTGNTTFTVLGILPSAGSYTLNGTYTRNGNFQSIKNTSNKGTHTVNVTVTNVAISKTTGTITGGTATFSVSGNVPSKGNWSYSGTLVYNGDGTANLTLSGTVYIINLGTGLYTLKA